MDMTKTYKVATNEFLAPAGQDGFVAFKYMTNITYWGDMLMGSTVGLRRITPMILHTMAPGWAHHPRW